MTTKAGISVVLATAALVVGAGPASAHGGDTRMIHSCIVPSSLLKIVGARQSCARNQRAKHWPALDTNTTYRAGSGLSLSSGNVFSVTGAPWGGLSGVPAGFADNQDDVGDAWSGLSGVPPGFADGVDDVGASVDMKRDDQSEPKQPNDDDGFVHWNNLESVPGDLLDGDDDGSGKVSQLRSDLTGGGADTTPNESNDLVSLYEIKDLTTADGDGRIGGEFLKNGSIEGQDIGQGTITADDLAVSAVDGLTIRDESIGLLDFAPLVAQRHLVDKSVHYRRVDPQAAPAGERIAVTVSSREFGTDDMVTVSPPPDLENGLVYSGSDVLQDPAQAGWSHRGELTIYLYNVSASAVNGAARDWKVRVHR